MDLVLDHTPPTPHTHFFRLPWISSQCPFLWTDFANDDSKISGCFSAVFYFGGAFNEPLAFPLISPLLVNGHNPSPTVQPGGGGDGSLAPPCTACWGNAWHWPTGPPDLLPLTQLFAAKVGLPLNGVVYKSIKRMELHFRPWSHLTRLCCLTLQSGCKEGHSGLIPALMALFSSAPEQPGHKGPLPSRAEFKALGPQDCQPRPAL